MDHPGQRSAATRLDVDHRADAGTGTRQPADEGGGHVTDALPDKLTVTVMLRAGGAIGHQRAQQGIDGARTANWTAEEMMIPRLADPGSDHELGQALGYLANAGASMARIIDPAVTTTSATSAEGTAVVIFGSR